MLRAREQALADYLRRLAVCDRLRDIGVENNNQEMVDRARLLEDRAKDAYVQRTNRPGSEPTSFDEALRSQRSPARDAGRSSMEGSK